MHETRFSYGGSDLSSDQIGPPQRSILDHSMMDGDGCLNCGVSTPPPCPECGGCPECCGCVACDFCGQLVESVCKMCGRCDVCDHVVDCDHSYWPDEIDDEDDA